MYIKMGITVLHKLVIYMTIFCSHSHYSIQLTNWIPIDIYMSISLLYARVIHAELLFVIIFNTSVFILKNVWCGLCFFRIFRHNSSQRSHNSIIFIKRYVFLLFYSLLSSLKFIYIRVYSDHLTLVQIKHIAAFQ